MSDLSFSVLTDQSTGENRYVAEFTANEAVSIHFEREKAGFVVFEQRSGNTGNYATTRAYSRASAPLVFDTCLVSDVYPINWKITSETQVTNTYKS